MDEDYRELVEELWRAYTVYVSSGCTHGAFDRHIWPVINKARQNVQRQRTEECPRC